jgi:hypothetical protein
MHPRRRQKPAEGIYKYLSATEADGISVREISTEGKSVTGIQRRAKAAAFFRFLIE